MLNINVLLLQSNEHIQSTLYFASFFFNNLKYDCATLFVSLDFCFYNGNLSLCLYQQDTSLVSKYAFFHFYSYWTICQYRQNLPTCILKIFFIHGLFPLPTLCVPYLTLVSVTKVLSTARLKSDSAKLLAV